ncbi:hypothetical protein CVS29_17860 [Arthrobacter psychrochitiniphilus]|uniref:Uncharacterized protein n=1 Tax=Arthrobacter psychrochitiniphilus TaxID=291045 RepID=A0A2V3DLW2_9MICC|nr:hypothetical protein CVS29_17860 [Arthrobacter psychrochitiniphilus]
MSVQIRQRWALLLFPAAIFLTQCSWVAPDGSPGDIKSTTAASATEGSSSVTGISADAAKSAGAFAAPGDATLSIDSSRYSVSGSTVTVTVHNISDVDENYVLVFLYGRREISTVPIAVSAGQTLSCKVTLEGEQVSGVRLDGELLGEGVADLPVK